MASGLIAFRKTDRLTGRCQKFSLPASSPVGNHRGDSIDVLPAGQLSQTSDQERTDFAWLLITDIPAAVAQMAKKWLTKHTTLGDPPTVDRPRIINMDIDLLKIEYPAQASNIDKLFDVGWTQTITSIENFAIPWVKVRKAIKNKILTRVMTDAEWEVDPDAEE